MIVWRGRGILTLFIFAACMFGGPAAWRLAHGVTDMTALKATHYDEVFALSMVLAGVLMIACGLYLNRNPEQLVLDRQTGRSVRAGRQHTFMYLAMELWGAIALLGGLYMAYRFRGVPIL